MANQTTDATVRNGTVIEVGEAPSEARQKQSTTISLLQGCIQLFAGTAKYLLLTSPQNKYQKAAPVVYCVFYAIGIILDFGMIIHYILMLRRNLTEEDTWFATARVLFVFVATSFLTSFVGAVINVQVAAAELGN